MALVVYSLHCTARKSLKGNECARNEHHKSTTPSKGITCCCCCCCRPPKQQQQRQVHRVHPLPVPLLRNEQQEKKKERKMIRAEVTSEWST